MDGTRDHWLCETGKVGTIYVLSYVESRRIRDMKAKGGLLGMHKSKGRVKVRRGQYDQMHV